MKIEINKLLAEEPLDGKLVLEYYDEAEKEFKALTKNNIKSLIREVLEEDIRTMPHLNGVDISK